MKAISWDFSISTNVKLNYKYICNEKCSSKSISISVRVYCIFASSSKSEIRRERKEAP